MKFISMDAIMTRLKSLSARALRLRCGRCHDVRCNVARVRRPPGSRQRRGAAAEGGTFRIECIDGRGRGQVSVAGVANVSYRRPSMSGPDETDHALVRVKGAEICLAWKQFGGGGDGCYPVSEEVAGPATG